MNVCNDVEYDGAIRFEDVGKCVMREDCVGLTRNYQVKRAEARVSCEEVGTILFFFFSR